MASSGHLGKGLERWPCQLAFGIWVASQMPNQVDRGVVLFSRHIRGLWLLLREVSTLGLSGQFLHLYGYRLKIVSD